MAAGESLLSPQATRLPISRFIAKPEPAQPSTSSAVLEALTAREVEVEVEAVALAALGLSNDEIAEQLFISPLTARTHIHRAMAELGARDRARLVVIAYQSGLVKPSSNA